MKNSSVMNGHVSVYIDIAPSVEERLERLLRKYEINKITNLVKLSKDKVFSIKGMTPYMQYKLTEFMDEYELHFGMTDAEIAEYLDEGYLEEHPEEKDLLEAHKKTLTEHEKILHELNFNLM